MLQGFFNDLFCETIGFSAPGSSQIKPESQRSPPVPGPACYESEDRHKFQTAGEHVDGENDFGKSAVPRVVGHRADRREARSDIVEAGKNGGQVGLDREIIDRDDIIFVGRRMVKAKASDIICVEGKIISCRVINQLTGS